MDNQRLIISLLGKYRPGMELEIRIPATKESFSSMYAELLKLSGVIERSINIISSNVFEQIKPSTKYIRVFEYVDGVATDKYYQKTSIGHVDNVKFKQTSCRLSLNDEQPCPKFTTNPNALVRAKLRYSCIVDDWRFDITAVRQNQLSAISSQFPTIKNDLIMTNEANFLQQCTKFGQYEIELEYIGLQPPTIDSLSIVERAISMMGIKYEETAMYDEEIKWLAGVLSQKRTPYSFKSILNQAEQLNKSKYLGIFPLKNYRVTIKVDGERAVVHIDGNRCRILRAKSCIELPCDLFAPGLVTCVDVEICNNIAYILDVIIADSKEVHKLPFSERLATFDDVKQTLSTFMTVGVHTYDPITDLETDIKAVYNAKYPHATDGLIFTSEDANYNQTINLKWKSFEHNTIDFLVKECPTSLIGKPPYINKTGYVLYLLFSNINHNVRQHIGLGQMQNYNDIIPSSTVNAIYYPIQFSPSIDPLAYLWYVPSNNSNKGQLPSSIEIPPVVDKVVELAKDADLKWSFVRVRDDKVSGNDFRIAELTYINYVDRFNIEDLWNPPSSYFMQSKDKSHRAEVKTKRLIVSLLLKEHFSHSKWVIDLAGGRGADLPTWQKIAVGNLLSIDNDTAAVSELLRRKYELNKKRGGWIAPKVAADTWDYNYETTIIKHQPQLTIHTLVADLSQPSVDTVVACRQYGIAAGLVDGVNCSFGLHYMCDSESNISNILTFVHTMLRKGSSFMFTVMDGDKIFKLLKTTPLWEIKENDVVKYRIRKQYSGNTLSHAGQNISILLPMSSEEKTEPLCNITYLVAVAKKMGFELTLRCSFWDHIDRVENMARHVFSELTDNDKTYIELYSIVVFKKIK